MLGAQLDAFLGGQGVSDVQRPVAEVLQKTILVQFDAAPVNVQLFHSQVLTLSKRSDSSTKAG